MKYAVTHAGSPVGDAEGSAVGSAEGSAVGSVVVGAGDSVSVHAEIAPSSPRIRSGSARRVRWTFMVPSHG